MPATSLPAGAIEHNEPVFRSLNNSRSQPPPLDTTGYVEERRNRPSTAGAISESTYVESPRSQSHYPNGAHTTGTRQNGVVNGRKRIQDEEMNSGMYSTDNNQPPNLKKTPSSGASEAMRLPWTTWMTSNVKNHFVATVGEFVGTTMFLFFAFAGTEVAKIGLNTPTASGETVAFDIGVYLYIALAFGFSLMTNVWVFFRISGGLFNPAVTFAMLLVNAVHPFRAFWLFIAQIAGGIAASALTLGLFPTPFGVRTTLSANTSLVQGVWIEAFLTAELVFTIFMLAKEKHKATFIAPVGIGLALFIAEMVGVYWTGGSLNPARSFGPCVVSGTFESEHWIYWVGPFAGSIIAMVFYKFIKILEYETANPGQDAEGAEDADDAIEEAEKQREIRRLRAMSQDGEFNDAASPPPTRRSARQSRDFQRQSVRGSGDFQR